MKSQSHPRTVKLFIPWSKAMVAGATVDKPSYPGVKKKRRIKKRRKRARSRRRKLANA